ncbi:HPr family phosphocarrier protein [Paenibacillus gansuensis]|uniref:HPr family phosphocarrier protein n=1 Tax=Paenibacillus gansuensis TaxID=306542 RepID=A0ABW5PJU8_9BACL
MQQTFTIQNPTGIHARPARKLVQAAMAYPCTVQLEKDGKRFSAKSLVGVLSVGAKQGDLITVVAEGERENEAVQEIGAILEAVLDESFDKE